jgi:8-oxo-dGTP diphosphatase
MSTAEVPHIRVVAAVIKNQERFLITQRRVGGSLGGLWEFPSRRVEDDESDEAALQRELRERAAVSIDVGERLACRTHCYDGYTVDLALYRATLMPGQEPHPVGVEDLRWVKAADLENYRFPPADQGTMDLLLGVRRDTCTGGAAWGTAPEIDRSRPPAAAHSHAHGGH